MRIHKLAFAAACMTAVLSFTDIAAHADGLKVAVIDVARILNESEAGKVAKKKLEARFDELRKGIDARKEEAQKLKEELDKMKVLLDKDKGKGKLKDKEDKFAAKVAEFEKLRQEAEKEMQGRQADMTRDILKDIEGKVMSVVTEEKIDLLLDSGQGNVVLHASPSLDITSKVLALVNKVEQPAKEAPVAK
ncbi:MAG TPA: OmpH family outer membrane protein [Candidatus Deferrimicrobiaceae bacterium]|jgi:outer membrane protein